MKNGFDAVAVLAVLVLIASRPFRSSGASDPLEATIPRFRPVHRTARSAALEFESFLRSLSERDPASQLQKTEALESIFRGGPATKGNAYVLYYDQGRSKIGLSHLKLIIDGTVYEVHRWPTQSGSYLRQRGIVEGLRDSKPGMFPSGILEVPVTPEQKSSSVNFLRRESGPRMRYSLLNRLIHEDGYNCAGLLYEALRRGGVALPALGRAQFRPQDIFEQLVRSTPRARIVGSCGNFADNLIVPNCSSATFWAKRIRANDDFVPVVGPEFLLAEQKLSASLPIFANPRRMLGILVKAYSNTGDLPRQYTPEAAKTIPLITLLIEPKDLAALIDSKTTSAAARSIQFKKVDGKQYVRFFIHPNERETYRTLIAKHPRDQTSWIATPTSSTRSMIVRDAAGRVKPFALKLTSTVKMAGTTREILEYNAVRAITISDLLRGLHDSTGGRLPASGKQWGFLPEPFAVVPGGVKGGYIFRELSDGFKDMIVLPWFSLISKRQAKDRWIDELYRYSDRSSMSEFIWSDLVKPAVEFHSLLSIQNGIITEMHQQNTLLMVDRATRKLRGILLRDMDGNWIDHSIRVHRLGKPAVHYKDFETDASFMIYGPAQDSAATSYVDIFRTLSVEHIFKYVLQKPELRKLLTECDRFIVEQFNRQYPEARIENIAGYEFGWKTLHDRATTSQERAVYDKLAAEPEEDGPPWFFRVLLELYHRANVRKLRGEIAWDHLSSQSALNTGITQTHLGALWEKMAL